MQITVVGAGYVGLANAALLAQYHHVTVLDLNPQRVAQINARQCPIIDQDIQRFMASGLLNLTATVDAPSAYQNAELVIVATPTDYDPRNNGFDTSSVESVIDEVHRYRPQALVVVRSTVPVGFTERVRRGESGKTCCLPRSFYEKGARCTTAFTHRASLLASKVREQDGSRICLRKRRKKRCSSAADKRHRSRGGQALFQHLSGHAGGLFQ